MKLRFGSSVGSSVASARTSNLFRPCKHVKIPNPKDSRHTPIQVPSRKNFTKFLQRPWIHEHNPVEQLAHTEQSEHTPQTLTSSTSNQQTALSPSAPPPIPSKRKVEALLPHSTLSQIITADYEKRYEELMHVWTIYSLHTTPDQEVNVYSVIAGHALNAAAVLQEWKEFQRILAILKTYAVTSSYPYKRAVSALSHQNRHKAALKIIHRLQKRGLIIVSLFPPLLHTAARGGGHELVLKLLRSMLNDITGREGNDGGNDRKKDVVIDGTAGLTPMLFHVALRAILENLPVQAASFREELAVADAIIGLMKHYNVTPNRITFTILADTRWCMSLERLNHIVRVRQYFGLPHNCAVLPFVRTLLYLTPENPSMALTFLDSLAKTGNQSTQPTKPRKLPGRVVLGAYTLNIPSATYDYLISSLAKTQQLQNLHFAMIVMQRMKQLWYAPKSSSLLHLLAAAGSNNQEKLFWFLWDELSCSNQYRLGRDTYSRMIISASLLQHTQHLTKVGSILIEYAKSSINTSPSLSIIRLNTSFNCLFSCLAKKGRHSEVLELCKTLKNSDHHILNNIMTEKSYLSILHNVNDYSELHLAFEALKEMMAQRVEVSNKSKECIIEIVNKLDLLPKLSTTEIDGNQHSKQEAVDKLFEILLSIKHNKHGDDLDNLLGSINISPSV